MNQDLTQLKILRRDLHRHPELSHGEEQTAQRIRRFMEPFEPDEVITGIGGAGLAFIYKGAELGPTVLIRCELDALPIREANCFDHRSVVDGVSHKCGHDGHMAMVSALAPMLHKQRPGCGRVVLLYQPAEETGAGAAAVLADQKFALIRPDYTFALHNMPGYPLGEVNIKDGPFNCASRGLVVRLKGETSHAAHPEDGTSPAGAMCELIKGLSALSRDVDSDESFRLVTVVHARLGEVAFGTSPGEADVMATLRTRTDDAMERLINEAIGLARALSDRDGLALDVTWRDVFAASSNDAEAVAHISSAVRELGIPIRQLDAPHRWSEDFGLISATCKGAMFGLGAGDMPQLHHPEYDFPDALINVGATIFLQTIRDLLG